MKQNIQNIFLFDLILYLQLRFFEGLDRKVRIKQSLRPINKYL